LRENFFGKGPIRRGKGNIKMEHREKDFEDGRWMELTSHSEQWMVFVLMVLDWLLPVALAILRA
jgi:hypothetical protein